MRTDRENRDAPHFSRRRLAAAALLLALAALPPARAEAYVEAAYPLGKLIAESTNIVLMRVESAERPANNLVLRKVRDIKGTHKGETMKHNIGQNGFHPREWQTVMAWAKVGETALVFHNGGAAEVCIHNYWYQLYAGDWWRMSHGEPYLLRTFAGRPEKLATIVAAMLTGQEVLTPCMADGDKNALQLGKGRVQRMKASLKIQDYNPQRDFAGWGVEEFTPIGDMPGFTHYAPLSDLGHQPCGIAPADIDGDGKNDLCLYGLSRVVVLQNAGGSMTEVSLGANGPARWAGWADFDADGNSDLLLATPAGPRLLRNRKGQFDDLTAGLPWQGYYNLTAGAWLDYDGDKRPDILLADGFQGLRLYRNVTRGGPPGASPRPPKPPTLGPWYVIGPFDNPNSQGFDTVYPPEKEINLGRQYEGKAKRRVGWRPIDMRQAPDGQVCELTRFAGDRENFAVYLYRELTFPAATELPVSFGSDDTLTVWLNGRQIVAQNEYRGCMPDQALVTLRLRAGTNRLLLKVCQGSGQCAFYFATKGPAVSVPDLFEDVSDRVGLGAGGVAGRWCLEQVLVADFNGDGRPDILYAACPPGRPGVALNTPSRFVDVPDCGLAYDAGGAAAALGDFDGDGKADLFVARPGGCRLFRGLGGGRFEDATARSGALAATIAWATSAVWTDLERRGRPGLLVGCLKGPNRYFRNNGDGTFTDATDALGLWRRIFSTRVAAAVDVNGDDAPDAIFANEALPSCVLLGNPTPPGGNGNGK